MSESGGHDLGLVLDILLAETLDVDPIQHGHLGAQVLTELHVLLLALLDVLELYGSQSLIEVLEQLAVLLSMEEGGDEGLLFFLEGDELLQLLLLKFIAYELNILAEISDLGDLLFLVLSELSIDTFDVLLDFLLGLQETGSSGPRVFTFCHLLEVEGGQLRLWWVEVGFVEGTGSRGG